VGQSGFSVEVFGINPADSSGYIAIQVIILHMNSKAV
jgi:hypothetical protein